MLFKTLQNQAINRLFSALSHIEYGEITLITPTKEKETFKGSKEGAKAIIEVHNWKLISSVLTEGDVGLAKGYAKGLWDSPDISEFLLFSLQNEKVLSSYIKGSILSRFAGKILYFFNRNTIEGSKKNIFAHYDLGNNFYSLWLDETMTYSSAIFKNKEMSLKEAQINKYDRIIEKLKPTGSLLEIGCGWGGFAARALEKGDYLIKGLTLSKAQQEFAIEKLKNRAIIALEDYRHQKSCYDQIVSIEMFEAVGEQYWPVYFSQIKSLLAPKGKAIIQTITIADDQFEAYKNSADAIRSFIFPGGMLPSKLRFEQEVVKARLKVVDAFSFGQDYAETLCRWLKTFDEKVNEVKALGFNAEFIRMWRFYLSFCISAFRSGRTDVVQWELDHCD